MPSGIFPLVPHSLTSQTCMDSHTHSLTRLKKIRAMREKAKQRKEEAAEAEKDRAARAEEEAAAAAAAPKSMCVRADVCAECIRAWVCVCVCVRGCVSMEGAVVCRVYM